MTVCKFFLQGRCKFGFDCRYEHTDGGGGANRQLQFGGRDKNNRYKWTAPQQDNRPSSSSGRSSPEGLLVEIKQTIEEWEQGKIWPFSCLGLDKDMPCIPGFSDISPDEMRWEVYNTMKSSGNLQGYGEKLNQVSKDYKSMRDQFKMPSSNFKEELKQFILKCRQTSGSSNLTFSSPTLQSFNFGNPNAPTNSAFGNAQSTNQVLNNSVFGQHSQSGRSVFGNAQSTNPVPNNSVFGQQSQIAGSSIINATSSTNPVPSNSVFGQNGGNAFGLNTASNNSVFGQKSQTGGTVFGTTNSGPVNSSVFGQQSQNTGSVFGQSSTQGNASQGLFGNLQGTSSQSPQSSANLFTNTGSTFGNLGADNHSSSVFGAKTSGGFGQSSTENSTKHPATAQNSTLYTPKDKLSAEDIAQFESNVFTIGHIPVKPPPRELVK